MYGRYVSDDWTQQQLLFSLVTYGDEHSTSKKHIAPKITPELYLSHELFFSLTPHMYAYDRLSFLSFSPSLPASLFLSLRLSDETHRSGTMVALYSTAALVEFGLAPAKRYSRCSRHVGFIVADRSINRFRTLFPRGGGGL